MVYTKPITFASSASIWPGDTPPFLHSKSFINLGLGRHQWKTIVATQQHIFPADLNLHPPSPGASDINAKAFLYALLSDPKRDDEDRKLVKAGAITFAVTR